MGLQKQKSLLVLARVLGLAAAGVLAVAKCPYTRVMAAVTRDDSPFGDLYVDAKLTPFKIRLPDHVGTLEQSDPAGSSGYRLFAMGDSYMPENRGHEPFPRLLSLKLGEPVFFNSWRPAGPLCLFAGEEPKTGGGAKRVLLLERAERYMTDMARAEPCPRAAPPENAARRGARKAFDMVFKDSEERLRYLLLNSVVTAPLVERWNTELYVRFGILPDLTPVVSTAPPFLFSRLETDPGLASSYYAPHDDALVAAIADNVAAFASRLRAEHGVELVFMPVPNKYTLYHRFARPDDAYNGFLPRLYAQLERRHVRYIDLYHPFLASPKLVYFPTDGHWNGAGVDLALDEAVRAVRDVRARRD